MDIRITKVGNDSRLEEGDTTGSDGEDGPNQRKEPQPTVLQGGDQFAQVEVELVGARGVGRKAGLDNGLFLLRQPLCRGGDYTDVSI